MFLPSKAREAGQLPGRETAAHLLPGSPAIDAGIDLGNDGQGQPVSGVTDIDGQPRVRGGAIDIGAHEFDTGVPDTTPPAPPINVRVDQ